MKRTNAIRWMFAGVGLAAFIFLLTMGQERYIPLRTNTYESPLSGIFGRERTYSTTSGGYTVRDTPLDFLPFADEFFWDGWGYALAVALFLWGAYRFLTAPRDKW